MNKIAIENLTGLTERAIHVQDTSHNLRIASLRKLTRDLEVSRTPDETLRTLQRGFTETSGFIASMLLSTRGLRQGEYRVVSTHLTQGSQKNLLDPALQKQGPVYTGGVFAAITARPEPQLIQEVDWSHDPFLHDTLKGYTSVIAVPIFADRLPMNWSFLLKRAPERFTVSDLEAAVERTALAGALLENQVLAADLVRANQQIDREARQVGELQRAFLPASLPEIAGLEIAASYQPSGRAGGDLYDFFALDEHHNDDADANGPPTRWCVFIGDTAGHGLASAIIMATVQAVLHAHPARIARPATLLRHANRQLCSKPVGGFVTAFLGIYEPRQRRFTYTNAGHPPPLLRRSSDGSIQTLNDVGSYPLGIDASETFEEAIVQLEPDDSVLLYTDGITEARDTNGDQFDSHRLMCVFRDSGDRPAGLIDRLRQAVLAHEHGQAARDDQTLVVARVL
jgi:sigma-B regulation protein RsbU (phosphoserine phosphatase)